MKMSKAEFVARMKASKKNKECWIGLKVQVFKVLKNKG